MVQTDSTQPNEPYKPIIHQPIKPNLVLSETGFNFFNHGLARVSYFGPNPPITDRRPPLLYRTDGKKTKYFSSLISYTQYITKERKKRPCSSSFSLTNPNKSQIEYNNHNDPTTTTLKRNGKEDKLPHMRQHGEDIYSGASRNDCGSSWWPCVELSRLRVTVVVECDKELRR